MYRIGKLAAHTPNIVQRQPFFGPVTRTGFLRGGLFGGMEDPLHQPIIDRYRRETGLRSGEGPSDAMIKYVLVPAYFAPRAVLNRERHDSPAYVSAVTNWPDAEPQNDSLFTAQSAIFRSYVSEGILTIGRLAAFNERGQYIEQTEQTFVQTPAGSFVNQPLTLGQRIALSRLLSALSRLLSAFAIADDADAWRVTIQEAGIALEDHLRREGRLASDDNIVFAARFIIGLTFRRSPNARTETITPDLYLDLLGRRDLTGRLRQDSSTRSPASSTRTP
jgi:hypothetical protein